MQLLQEEQYVEVSSFTLVVYWFVKFILTPFDQIFEVCSVTMYHKATLV